jgi:hypothetical protein
VILPNTTPPSLLIAQFCLFRGTFRTLLRIVQFVQVAGTDGKGHLHPFAQEALLHLRFQEQIEAGAGEQQVRHRAGITEFASPGPGIVGAGLQQTTFFQVGAPVIVAEKVSTVD